MIVKAARLLAQGHSKKAGLDGSYGLGSVLGEDFADFGEWAFEGTDDTCQGISHGGHGLRSGPGSDLAGILSEDDITSPVQSVLDRPMVSDEREQSFWTGLGSWQAGDGVDDLVTDLALAFAGPGDAADLGDMGPVETGDYFVTDRDVSGFNPAVLLSDSLCALNVRGWSVQSGWRRLALECIDQFRGEKRRRRRRQGRPSRPAGWP